jgi:HEAT repeat protein
VVQALLVSLVMTVAVACGPAAQPAEPTADELLERFTGEPVFWRQFDIAKALVARRDAPVLIPLERMLSHEDRHVRANVAFVFAGHGDPRGIAIIKAIVADRSDRPLGQGIPTTRSNLAQPRWRLRRQVEADRYFAVHMLGELRDRRGIDVLVPLLEDPDVNYKVAWALGQIGDPRATRPLIAALDDGNAFMRVSAIQALEMLDATEALPWLRALVNDPELPGAGPRVPVGETAKAAIRKLTRVPR